MEKGTPPAPPAPAAPAADTAADQSLADMAQRLEAALRKPGETAPLATTRPAPAESMLPPPPPRTPPRPSEAKPAARTDAKPGQGKTEKSEKTALYDSLEQEMASLLGRPTKT